MATAKQPFVSIYGYTLTKKRMEKVNTQKSETVKGQTYTIRQLVERAANGLIPVLKESVWSENPHLNDHDLEKVSRMDLAEKQEIMEQTRERVHNLKAALEEQQAKVAEMQKKNAAQQEALQKEKFMLWQKELNKKQES